MLSVARVSFSNLLAPWASGPNCLMSRPAFSGHSGFKVIHWETIVMKVHLMAM